MRTVQLSIAMNSNLPFGPRGIAPTQVLDHPTNSSVLTLAIRN
ncbi:hypothetical protein [Massilia phosphatilytica]